MKAPNSVTFILILVSILLSGRSSQALTVKITPKVQTAQLTFQYISNDGSVSMDCVHSQIRDLPDWDVVCGKGTNLQKRYTVHFITKQYNKAVQPITSFEYLYWVTQWESVAPVYSSTSFWIRLKEKTSLQSIRMYQSVENDYADLVVDYNPLPTF